MWEPRRPEGKQQRVQAGSGAARPFSWTPLWGLGCMHGIHLLQDVHTADVREHKNRHGFRPCLWGPASCSLELQALALDTQIAFQKLLTYLSCVHSHSYKNSYPCAYVHTCAFSSCSASWIEPRRITTPTQTTYIL